MGKMSQFVGQNGFDFARFEPCDERVEQHDAFGCAKTGEVGVTVAGALRVVHDEQAVAAKAAARQQGLDAFTQ